jgi:bifunctional polynucleotide phosphatase/kinase
MKFPHVPAVLASLHASGHAIVIVTNESMDRFKKPDVIRSAMMKKTGRLAGFAAAANVPMLALCATAKDAFRKPGTAAWSFFCEQANGGVKVDTGASFFVGDAAGRPADHSDSDLVFARAAGLPFHDEKGFFLKLHPPK